MDSPSSSERENTNTEISSENQTERIREPIDLQNRFETMNSQLQTRHETGANDDTDLRWFVCSDKETTGWTRVPLWVFNYRMMNVSYPKKESQPMDIYSFSWGEGKSPIADLVRGLVKGHPAMLIVDESHILSSVGKEQAHRKFRYLVEWLVLHPLCRVILVSATASGGGELALQLYKMALWKFSPEFYDNVKQQFDSMVNEDILDSKNGRTIFKEELTSPLKNEVLNDKLKHVVESEHGGMGEGHIVARRNIPVRAREQPATNGTCWACKNCAR